VVKQVLDRNGHQAKQVVGVVVAIVCGQPGRHVLADAGVHP